MQNEKFKYMKTCSFWSFTVPTETWAVHSARTYVFRPTNIYSFYTYHLTIFMIHHWWLVTGSFITPKQEAQLSQRGRAILCVIEYFAKSLKVTRGHWKWHHSIDRIRVPMVFHSNYDSILYHFRDTGQKSRCFHTPCQYSTLPLGVPVGILP